MPNPNAIVSTRIRLDRSPGQQLDRERAVEVELEGGRRVRIDAADPRSDGFARVLEGLSAQGMPVYVEVDPVTDAVTRVLVPHVTRIVDVAPARRGDVNALDVEFDASHARHVLRTDGPDAADLERELRAALANRDVVIVTEDEGHNIIDVRAFTPAPDGDGGMPPFLPPLREPIPIPIPKPSPWDLERIRRLIAWVWWIICWPWWWYRCPSPARAQEIFDAMASTTCEPLTVPPPCIPFLYPDDGCWARAHEMCRLMIGMGLSPRKVWIDHSAGNWLHVDTKNNPQCYVEWGWHVAPTLCVRRFGRWPWFFRTQRMVIDPSLFTTPVTKATWKGVQGDPGATLTDTGPEQFWHGGGDDPTYSSSNSILAQYRLALQNRSNQVGPPPYANCP